MVMFVCLQLHAAAQDKPASAGTEKNDLYSLNVFAGGGVSFYLSNPGTPHGLNTQVSQIHPIGSLRVMWYPDHLLRIGLETGISNFYSYKFHDTVSGTVAIQSVPLILVFSMPVTKHINVYMGPGDFFVTSKLHVEQSTKSSTFSLGWMAAVAYEYPINKDLNIAGEVKLLNAFESKDVALSVQIQIHWKFMEW
jgi:hypothetical protein